MMTLKRRGFTLVEILVAMALLGILMMAIYSLYLTTQRTASSQEEVVELQQNLRIAMDQMVRDIRMAGFVITLVNPPIDVAPNLPSEGTPFKMNTASPSGKAARLDQDKTVPLLGGGWEEFTLGSPEMVDLFYADPISGDQVRILRPPSQDQPYAQLFRVVGKNRTNSTITLEGFGLAGTPLVEYKAGDGVVVSSSTYPGTIAFYLKENEVFKQVNEGAAQRVTAKRMVGTTLVNGVTGLAFEYLMDDGSTLSAVSGSTRWNIKAVKVTVTGQANVQNEVKTRSLSNVIALRNR